MSIFYTNVARSKNKIQLRGYNKVDGSSFSRELDFKPVLYVLTNDAMKEMESMSGLPLSSVKFDSIQDMQDAIRNVGHGFAYYGMKTPEYQFITRAFPGNIDYDENIIRGFFCDIEVFSGDVDETGKVVAGPFPNADEANYPITAVTLYNVTDKTFYAYGLETFKDIKLGTWVPDEATKHLKISYKGYDKEYDLLSAVLQKWVDVGPDWVSGWNSEGFDVPYIINRMTKVLGKTVTSRLSPWGYLKKRTTTTRYGQQTFHTIQGVSSLDMKSLFEKHGFISPVDWKLGTVAEEISGAEKLSYEEEGSLHTLYIENYQKYISYNIIDVDLVKRLDDKKKFISLTYVIAYITKSNYEDTMATVAPWSALLYDMLNGRKVQPEIKSPTEETDSIPGGLVQTPLLGLFKWVLTFDLASLYPHIMQQYNMGPETLIDPSILPNELRAIPDFNIDDLLNERIDLSALKKYNVTMTSNRQFFRRDKMSIFNEKTRDIYSARSSVKKVMKKEEQVLENMEQDVRDHKGTEDFLQELMRKIQVLESAISSMDSKQLAYKILMNALFGATSNRFFTEYYDKRIAGGITTSGQLSQAWVAKAINDYLNKVLGTGEITYKHIPKTSEGTADLEYKGKGVRYVVYGDTDSVFVNFGPLVEKMFPNGGDIDTITEFLDKLSKEKIEPLINECYVRLADYVNAHEQRMFMKREKIAPALIMNGKKRYTSVLKDDEGVRYADLKLQITGLESRRGNVPKQSRKWLEECYRIALTKDEEAIHEKVKDIKQAFISQTVEAVSSPKTANNLQQYSDKDTIYTKGCPKHVRAALYHNHLVNKLGLIHVPEIITGNKVLFVPLKQNKYGFDVIGFEGYLPSEFELHDKVDFNRSFDDNFLGYLDNLLKTIGWSAEKKATLNEFWS